MIKINLLGEKIDKTASYLLQGFAALLLIGGASAACIVTYSVTASSVNELSAQKRLLESKTADLRKKTEKVAGLEQKKKTIREKLSTIAVLKARKNGPVHVLDDLNLAVPERAWLVSAKDKEGKLELTGLALDDQTVSAFMYTLEQSKYFTAVELIQSAEQSIKDVRLKQFALLLTIRDPLAELKAKASQAAAAAAGSEPKLPGKDKVATPS
jgi:type IV pilus assembly protein PilN